MSLINQMLQELDARRAEGAGSAEYGQQVRAVPERRRIHPAWWAALALGIALLCVAGWVLFRPAAAPAQAARQELPLRLDTRLGAQAHVTQADVAAASSSPATPAMPAVSPSPAPDVPAMPTPATSAATSADKNSAPPSVPPVVSAPSAPPAQVIQSQPEPEPARRKSAPASRPSTEEDAANEASTAAALPRTASSARPRAEALPSFASPKQSREPSQQQRAENEYGKALVAVEQGRIGDGITGLEIVLQLDARHAAARQSLIGLLLNAKRQDEATERARQGLALDEAQPGLAMILARLQLEKGSTRAAVDTLERTLPYARDRADYLAFLAALLQRDERHKQAAEYYFQALQRSPQNGVWWMGLGISLQADQRPAEASEAFRRAKSTNSLTPELTAFVNARLSQLQR